MTNKDGSISFNFTVSSAKVAKAYQEVVQEYAATAEIKGFRKGKAPLDLVERSLDPAQVYSHALEHILPQAYADELKKRDLHPVIDPRITPISMEPGKDWEFKAETAGRPEVTLGDYKKYVSAALKKLPIDKKSKKEKESPKNEPDKRLSAALDALLANAKLDIAPILVEEEARTALKRLSSQLKSLKLSLADYAKSIKKSAEELTEEYKKSASVNLKLEFILMALINDIKPEVKEAEPHKKYALQRQKVLDIITRL